MANIVVNPKVITWARVEAHLTQLDAADKIGLQLAEIVALEVEARPLTLGVLRKMASVYGVAIATLAMPEPLKSTKMPSDFRTIDGRQEEISRETALAIRRARHYLELMADLTDEEEDLEIRYAVPDASANDTSQTLAARERARFSVSVEEQLKWKDGQAFRIWRDKVEALGIYVYVLDFPKGDCRGFSLRESKNPAIAISKEESFDGAKVFTLLHEYCHILKNEPGISNLNNNNKMERFCNEFAAHFLMPIEALKRVLSVPDKPQHLEWDFEVIRLAAKRLHVSQQALALRLENAGYARSGFFDALRSQQFKLSNKAKKKQKSAPIAPEIRRLSEVGAAYASTTLAAYDRGSLNAVEAFRILGLSPKHFEGLRVRLRGRLLTHGSNRPLS
jgi:Zn-dependent peptidase ImmA (M78 family)/DNA-binding XRE family transcriptional regulator